MGERASGPHAVVTSETSPTLEINTIFFLNFTLKEAVGLWEDQRAV